MIQGRTDVLYRITDNETPVRRRTAEESGAFDDPPQRPGVSRDIVLLGLDDAESSSEPFLVLRLQRVEVEGRSAKLGSAALERIRHATSS
jgi:hypothetical protein